MSFPVQLSFDVVLRAGLMDGQSVTESSILEQFVRESVLDVMMRRLVDILRKYSTSAAVVSESSAERMGVGHTFIFR